MSAGAEMRRASSALYSCLRELWGRHWPAFIAAVAFGAHASHWESLAYVAGRTDTLAALAFLAALRCYLALRGKSAWSMSWVLVLYFVALLGKEYTLGLPVLLLLLDWLMPRGTTPRSFRDSVRRSGRRRAVLGFATVDGAARRAARPLGVFTADGRAAFCAQHGAALSNRVGGFLRADRRRGETGPVT